jgi:hypothetical protein
MGVALHRYTHSIVVPKEWIKSLNFRHNYLSFRPQIVSHADTTNRIVKITEDFLSKCGRNPMESPITELSLSFL